MNCIPAAMVFLLAWETLYAAPDPLPSWNPGQARAAIIEFLDATTRQGSPAFVAPEARVAVFDNDGTLWCEQPAYTQFEFGMDRVKAQAANHTDWRDKEPFKSALAGDLGGLIASGVTGLNALTAGVGQGMEVEEYHQQVRDWLATARHPRFGRPYTECVYQPMLEVLACFRAHGFKIFIVSGGAVEFMRPWTEAVYGVPAGHVIGSTVMERLEWREGKPLIVQTGRLECINDGAEKVLSIQRVVGQRPIAAFGNSDGDLPMLEWTAAGSGARLCVYIHHTDADREYAYDRNTAIGRLDKGLDQAAKRHWTVVDMKHDWRTIFPPKSGG